MLLIKDALRAIFVLFLVYQASHCKYIVRRSEADYDAAGDYFEANPVSHDGNETVSEVTTGKSTTSEEVSTIGTTELLTANETTSVESTKNPQSISKESKSESLEDENDDGVTCSSSNVTEILSKFEVEHTVLVIFKVNVTEHERELLYFLNLARRFSEAPTVFIDHRFIVLTTDNSSDIVNDFIDENHFPGDIVVLDEDDYPDLGFVIDLDELHVYVVDQCGKLAYIIVPPWSSAQHPYVKAALISTIIDLPCECPASEFSSNKIDAMYLMANAASENSMLEVDSTTTAYLSTPDLTGTSTADEFGEEDIENIEELLDNMNRVEDTADKSENFSIPLRIIIPSVHVHYDENSGDYYKYNEIILKSDDENYHNHYESGDKLLDISDQRLQTFTDRIFVGNKSFSDIKEQVADGKVLVNRLGSFYKILKKQQENVYDVGRLEFDVIKVPPSIQIFGVQHHYKQLNKWIPYKI